MMPVVEVTLDWNYNISAKINRNACKSHIILAIRFSMTKNTYIYNVNE